MAKPKTDNLGKRKLFIRKEGRWEELVVQKHGRWGKGNDCSECGCQPWFERDIHTLNYCPNCGAKMDGGET